MISPAQAQLAAALATASREDLPAHERASMLVEIAMGLQLRPRFPQDLDAAAQLYESALALSFDEPALHRARIKARLATALYAHPEATTDQLRRARELIEAALESLRADGDAEELGEAELNLGLVIHALAGQGAAALGAAIAAYQRALQVFRAESHPAEFAILHNNLATAYLAGAGAAPGDRMREALAVQSFETALAHISLEAHPREYAMLQNNLGNALQYAASGHALENNLRALEAYAEALKVRNARDTPIEYANTLANMANCLSNLPPDDTGADPRQRAVAHWREARELFLAHGASDKVAQIDASLAELDGSPA